MCLTASYILCLEGLENIIGIQKDRHRAAHSYMSEGVSRVLKTDPKCTTSQRPLQAEKGVSKYLLRCSFWECHTMHIEFHKLCSVSFFPDIRIEETKRCRVWESGLPRRWSYPVGSPLLGVFLKKVKGRVINSQAIVSRSIIGPPTNNITIPYSINPILRSALAIVLKVSNGSPPPLLFLYAIFFQGSRRKIMPGNHRVRDRLIAAEVGGASRSYHWLHLHSSLHVLSHPTHVYMSLWYNMLWYYMVKLQELRETRWPVNQACACRLRHASMPASSLGTRTRGLM